MPPPANDTFSAAIALVGASGSTGWSNVGTPFGTETGELAYLDPVHFEYPVSSKTLWYTITPAADGGIMVDTVGTPTNIAPLMAVYEGGPALGQLVPIQHATFHSGGNFQARLLWKGLAGVTYYIQLGVGWTGATTAVGVLNWRTAACPAHDDYANASVITGASGSTTGDTTGATPESTGFEEGTEFVSKTIPAAHNAPFSWAGGLGSVWHKWVATGDGILELELAGSAIATMMAVFHGDNLVGASDDVYHNNTLVQEPALVRCRVESGETYYIRVCGERSTANPWGTYALAWSLSAPTVTGDYYDDAITISGASGTTSGSLADCSTEEGEPFLHPPGTPTVQPDLGSNLIPLYGTWDAAYDWGGYSIWYEWTCPADGVYQFDTIGSTCFTILGVFPDAPTSLQLDPAAGRANSYGAGGGENYESLVTIRCTAGSVYKVVVMGDYNEDGDYILNWDAVTPPPNDDIANAIALTGTGSLTGVSNVGATYEDGEIKPADEFGSGRSLWYKVELGRFGFLSTLTGTAHFNGDWMDVTVWEGPDDATSPSQLTRVADDGNGFDGGTTISLGDIAGSGTLYIQVDSYEGVLGTFDLAWSVTRLADADRLDYNGPKLTGSFFFLGYIGTDDADRNLIVEVTYSTSGNWAWVGATFTPTEYATASFREPGVPNTSDDGSHWGTGSVFLDLIGGNHGIAEVELDVQPFSYAGDTSGSTFTRRFRIPLPEDEGIIEVAIGITGTLYLTEYHIYVEDPVDPPVNDQPLHAIAIGGPDGSSGTFVIPEEAWAGARLQAGEPVLYNSGDSSAFLPEDNFYPENPPIGHGRTVWYRWTPENDTDVLYLWQWQTSPANRGDYRVGTNVTVFDDVDGWSYILAQGDGTVFGWWETPTVDPAGHPGNKPPLFNAPLPPPELTNEFGQTEIQYVAIPARVDAAGTVGGVTLYIRLDPTFRLNGLPTFDWNMGWFVRTEPMEQYGPDDLGILNATTYAVSDPPWYFIPDHQDDMDEGTILTIVDPAGNAISGYVGLSFDMPHVFQESEIAALGDTGDAVTIAYEGFDIDDDGVVYASGAPHYENMPFGEQEQWDIYVWDSGLLNLPEGGRFMAALEQAAAENPGLDSPPFGFLAGVKLVGDEVWIEVGASSPPHSAERVMVRCSKAGRYLGITDCPSIFGLLPMWNLDGERRTFISGGELYDSEDNSLTALGLDPNNWIPYDGGLVRANSGTNLMVQASNPFSFETNVKGAAWEYPAANIAVVDTWFAQVRIAVSWTGGGDVGLILRYWDANNYIKCNRTGIYEIRNGVETLLDTHPPLYFGINDTMWCLCQPGSVWANDSNFFFGGGVTEVESVVGHQYPDQMATRWGIWADDFSKITSFTILHTSDTISLDVIGPQYNPWDGQFRIEGWDIASEVYAAEDQRVPYFDTWDQATNDFAIGIDGKTLYVARWWEAYPEHARDNLYAGVFENFFVPGSPRSADGELAGNWIQTSVYAFDLETLTYIGKVGQYDLFPSWGFYEFYYDIYPYVMMGGDIYSGLRERATLRSVDAQVLKPATPIDAAVSGATPSPRPKTIDTPIQQRATSFGRSASVGHNAWTDTGLVPPTGPAAT